MFGNRTGRQGVQLQDALERLARDSYLDLEAGCLIYIVARRYRFID